MSYGEYNIKCCIMGSNNDLNTQFGRLTEDTSLTEDNRETIEVDVQSKRIKIEGITWSYKLFLWVVSGKKYSQAINKLYYQNSQVAIILFDSGVEESIKTVSNWYNAFRKVIPDPAVPVAIVAIKSDKQKEGTKEEKQIEKELKAIYFETAIDNRKKIDQIFIDLVKRINHTV